MCGHPADTPLSPRPAVCGPSMEDGRELELTYITERIIAVSFPAGCSEDSYLHSLQEVTRMLRSKHGDNYLVSKRLGTGWTLTAETGSVC